ncbi:hypothetical protein DFH27DRAFT_656756 [Peziza echinospora]|nr:hypothetical protein DFH27DRAFT_656756 [Peziza echinospora]
MAKLKLQQLTQLSRYVNAEEARIDSMGSGGRAVDGPVTALPNRGDGLNLHILVYGREKRITCPPTVHHHNNNWNTRHQSTPAPHYTSNIHGHDDDSPVLSPHYSPPRGDTSTPTMSPPEAYPPNAPPHLRGKYAAAQAITTTVALPSIRQDPTQSFDISTPTMTTPQMYRPNAPPHRTAPAIQLYLPGGGARALATAGVRGRHQRVPHLAVLLVGRQQLRKLEMKEAAYWAGARAKGVVANLADPGLDRTTTHYD